MDPVVTPNVQADIERIVSCLFNIISRQIEYLTKLNENAKSLTSKMSELKALKEDIDLRVDDCERQGMECKNTVKDWRHKVESVQGEVTAIDAGFQQSKSCLQACYPNCCSSRYKLGKKIVKTIAEVSELINKGKEFDINVAHIGVPAPVETKPSTSVVGVELMIERVLNHLKQDDVRIIGLYGMGGVGKTTILDKINNNLVGNPDFDFKIVISVALNKDVKPTEIQKAIYERLRMPWSEEERLERRAINLYKNLCKSKYLLLLDNMWDYLDLVNVIGVPEPTAQNKCKVVFTTRNEEVCGSMGAHRMIKIEVLGEADAWNLFQEKVGEWISDCPSEVLSLAKVVAKKCGGLPLALITVGRAMANKKTPPEWRNAERALPKVKGMDNVLSLLKYSYDCLQDDATKSCFLYCSFFPESRDIKIEDVIRYWIGEGYFDEIESYTEAYDKGCVVLGSLKRACLLESGVNENTFVRMHDVIREMALCEVDSKFGKKAKSLLERPLISEESSANEWNEAERVFLISEGLSEIPESPTCPKLSTLILEWNHDLMNFPETFFQNMHALRVVNLRWMFLSRLPQSFFLLENLRFLNLSCTKFKELPKEIGRLIKLKHLDLSWTILESLPQEFGDLCSLEHLNLEETKSLQTIPHTTISKLSHLKELNFFKGFRNWELKEWGDDGIGVKLEELESLKQLRILGINIENDHIFQRLFQSPFLLKRTKHLEIKNSKELSLQPLLSTGFAKMCVLHTLRIISCKRLEEFIIGSEVEENFLGSLQDIKLENLPNLNSIWEGMMPQGCLGKLCSLSITKCPKLKSLRWVHNLPCLESLGLGDCDEMEEILGDDEVVEDIIFPKLQKLYLCNLPKLVSFYPRMLLFPSLEILYVRRCPQLKKLPLGGKMRKGEWWETLEWAALETKMAFKTEYEETEDDEMEDDETNKVLVPLHQQTEDDEAEDDETKDEEKCE